VKIAHERGGSVP